MAEAVSQNDIKRPRLDVLNNSLLCVSECPAKPQLGLNKDKWIPAEVSIHNLFMTPMPTKYLLSRLAWSNTRKDVALKDVQCLFEEYFAEQLEIIFDVGRNILGHYLRCLLKARLCSKQFSTCKKEAASLQVLGTCQCCYCLQEYLEHANHMCGEAFEELWNETVNLNSWGDTPEKVNEIYKYMLEYMLKNFRQTTLAARIRQLAEKKKVEYTHYLWNHISKHGIDSSKVKHGCVHVH